MAAQYPGVQSTVERQIQTLEQKKAYAEGLIAEADAKIKDPLNLDFEFAYAHYKSAVDILPRGGSAVESTRQTALDGFCAAGVKLAKQRVSQGLYADARAAIEVLLEERYNPNYEPALALRRQLLDPQGFVDRGTHTPQQHARTEEVKNLLREGTGFFDSGRYDLAFKRCEQALNIDKYNKDLPIMKQIIKETIVIYNEKRPHYSNHMLTPNQMHQQNKLKMKTYKTKNSIKNVFDAV